MTHRPTEKRVYFCDHIKRKLLWEKEGGKTIYEAKKCIEKALYPMRLTCRKMIREDSLSGRMGGHLPRNKGKKDQEKGRRKELGEGRDRQLRKTNN